jgi:hypothetical protein
LDRPVAGILRAIVSRKPHDQISMHGGQQRLGAFRLEIVPLVGRLARPEDGRSLGVVAEARNERETDCENGNRQRDPLVERIFYFGNFGGVGHCLKKARISKFEIRNKFESEKPKNDRNESPRLEISPLLNFGHCFGFRASDFEFHPSLFVALEILDP